MRSKYIFGILVIVILIVFAGINLQKSMTPYVSLKEAMATDSVVQFKGSRVVGSEKYNPANKEFAFRLVDDNGEECQVVYRGVKPANFEQATEVVAIGRHKDGIFQAEQLLVKCPSKYQAEGTRS